MKNLKKNLINQINILTITVLSSSVWAQKTDFLNNVIQNSWGLKNSGQAQIFDLNPLQTYRLQARAHQDIHLAPPVVGRKIRVAVVDTGVDVTHPLLSKQIAFNKIECEALKKYETCVETNGISGCRDMLSTATPGMDLDKNQYPGDCHGWSILGDTTVENVIGTPSFKDDIGHGTHVAGIIASVSKNIEIIPVQVIGEAPNQPIKPFSIDLSPNENTRGGFSPDANLADRIARGIIYAINAKADVINLSIGWPQAQDADIMREAIEAAQKKGIIIIAAAGNDSTTALLRPCQYKGVICVAAHRPDGSIAHFSNFGFGVDIAAPGASIVSTIPFVNRSIRLPGYSGVDILSGTSQASPFVAGVVAEMLSRGIKPEEIYPRLILGARNVMPELPVLVGPIQTSGSPEVSKEPYRRNILSGLLDMQNSLNVRSQPLVLNADKEVPLIKWNRKDKNLNFKFAIKNYWAPIASQKIDVQMALKNKIKVSPAITQVKIESADLNNFSQLEEKIVSVDLELQDQSDASLSQVPSDLSFDVSILVNGQLHRTFEMRAEIVVEFSKDDLFKDMSVLPVDGQLERGMKKYFIDEVYDNKPNVRDYIALSREKKSFSVSLVKFENNRYKIGPKLDIPFDGNIQYTKPYSRIRIDLDGDGQSEYVLGIQEFKEVDGGVNVGDYTMHFYIFDSKMNFKKHVSFYDLRALISLDYTWIKIGKELRPAWIGFGKPVIKEYNVMDLWQTSKSEKPNAGDDDIRLYYLDENYKLATIESKNEYKIVDILQPRAENVQKGILPVLLAKNLGTEAKPSYLYSFSIGYITQGQLAEQKTNLKINENFNYRNLVDTKKDKSVNLSHTSDEYLGTFWFGFDAHQKQRVTMIDYKTNSIVDQLLPNDRSLFDAPLRVRAAYSSQNQKGVFLMTNTEIEYHDLLKGTVARSSLNKYTYIGNDLMVDLQFPISLQALNSKNKIPALFTTEGSGLNRGVKFLIPTDYGDSKNYMMISPARLRLSAPQGCRAIDAPVYIDGNYHLDYDCGDKILRFKLIY